MKSFEEDLIPNALIFLRENWRTISHNQTERNGARRGYTPPRYTIGKIDHNE